MDGIHDLGGKHGYGRVVVEANEPAIHELWEARVFAIQFAALSAGAFNNTDKFRHGVERIDPVAYLTHGYYGRWLGALEALLVEAGVLSTDEISERAIEMGAGAGDLIAARPDPHPDVLAEVANLPTAARPIDRSPLYSEGDRVKTTTQVKESHTRLPAYARGKQGRIILCHNAWVYPDTNAHGQGENPQHLYTVQFEGEELWGANCENNLRVSLDLFELYLTPLEGKS